MNQANILKELMLAVMLLLLGVTPLSAQNRLEVSGTVTDASTGEPLIGVSIKETGTANGAVTDLDGNYKLSVRPGATLAFSYIGYMPVERKAAPKLNVAMSPDSKTLDDVVVVGYGVQKKSDLTGAITSVKAEDIQDRAISSINEAFAGKTSGVQTYTASGKPGSAPSIQIRGIGSNGSSAPLFVIDGRVTSSPGNIDPNDIESIEILKDGASAAIYGASAGNGVILVTTKKGKGHGKITYDVQLASQSIARVPHVMNSEQFINYYNDRGMLNMEGIYENWDFKTNTDWVKASFEPSFFMKHNLSFQGSSDRGQFYVSASYLDNNGMFKGDADTQHTYSGMINASYKVKPWLEVGTNNALDYSKISTISDGGQLGNIISDIIQMPPLIAVSYPANELPALMEAELHHDTTKYGELLTDKNGNYYGFAPYLATNAVNPFIERDHSTNQTRSQSLNGTTYLNLTPVKGLVLTSRLSYSFASGDLYSASKPWFASMNSGALSPYITVSASSSHSTYWQWENFGTYMRQFGKHSVGLMLGTSYSDMRSYGVTGSMSGNTNGDLGFSRNDPNFMYFAYATSGATKSLSGGEPSYNRKLAYFGRLNYDYRGTYLFQFSLRADAADLSILPRKNRWGYFPAMSAGWVISNEKFMSAARKWLSNLKVRASWGQNGSIASLGSWMYDATVARYGKYNFSNELNYSYSYAPTAMGNEDLKWETSEQFDIGLDLALFNYRLTLSADYYNKKTKDLIITGAKLSNISGFASSPINAGRITNKGFELEAQWRDRIGDFSYGIRGNLTTLKNKVTKVYDTVNAIDGTAINLTTVLTRFEKGQPAWYFYGYKYEGVNPENGEPVYEDITGDGQITEDDKTYIGKGIPDVTYGVTLNAAWKGLELTVFGSGVAGVDIYNMYSTSNGYTNNELTYYTEDRWTPEHTHASMPVATADLNKFRASSAHVMNGAYFKIKQIQLAYSLPQSLLRHICLEQLKVYCSLENFLTFTSYKGFDPEVVGTGVDMGLYPSSKKIVFGLNVTF